MINSTLNSTCSNLEGGNEALSEPTLENERPERHNVAELITVQGTPTSSSCSTTPRPPCPPFSKEDAIRKVRAAENAWNSKDPIKVSEAYTVDTRWRNRSDFINSREEVVEFLRQKWSKELDYKLIKEIWAYDDDRIAVRFAYEWHDRNMQFYRSYGNENWEFDEYGYMRVRHASINDVPIEESSCMFKWTSGTPRPESHPGLSELGL
jgi:nuclear transport factor 2 (NTF2) superfamily protein